jgi:hypothetical protein
MENNLRKDCLVIGGGLTGLAAATHLQSQGLTVKVLDKGRGIGGRLATRRMTPPQSTKGRLDQPSGQAPSSESLICDYGVQFLTANSPEFQSWLDQWQKLELIELRSGATEVKQYWGVNGIRKIAKHLASNLDVETSTKVVNLNGHPAGWTVAAEDGSTYDSELLILTAPLPQSLQLLQHSNLPQLDTALARLSQISYRMCLVVLLLVSAPLPFEQGNYYQIQGEQLDGMICNSQKTLSPEYYTVTLKGTAEFSQNYQDNEHRHLGAEELIAAARDYLGQANIIDYQVHFWRYSTPLTQFDAPFFSPPELIEASLPELYLAGDAFSSKYELASSVESAFLSGLEVARSIYSARRCLDDHS